MNKTAAEIQKMLNDASDVISAQVTKIAQLEDTNKTAQEELDAKNAELARYKRKDECEKLATIMIDKGLINPSDFRVEVQKYMASKEDVGMLMKAAELVIPKDASIEFVGGEDSNIHKTADQMLEDRLNNMR